MHHARDVVAGQVDALVVGDVIFDSTETLACWNIDYERLHSPTYVFRTFLDSIQHGLLQTCFCHAVRNYRSQCPLTPPRDPTSVTKK